MGAPGLVGTVVPGGVRVPRATYRLQFNRDFTFSDASSLVPYLAELGVGDLYASPYLKARPGSTHGYDVVDPTSLNPELGSERDYWRMVEVLRDHDMGQLLDIVPNHMGVGSDNALWYDVLESGRASPYAPYFDIDWFPAGKQELHGKVLLPILGDHYRAALERGEVQLVFDVEAGAFFVNYYEHRFPIDPGTYPMILESIPLPDASEHRREIGRLVTAFGNLPDRDDTEEESVTTRAREVPSLKSDLADLCARYSEVARAVEERVRWFDGEGSWALHSLLEAQAYRLVRWRVASDEINYRRFFAVNDLAGVRVEDEHVFAATHGLILRLIEQGAVDGLRIDHPDGLRDPTAYLDRLQYAVLGATGGPAYTLVEKILAHEENLPDDWPVSGTTGYDFTSLVNGLFVDLEGKAGIDEAYQSFIGESIDFPKLLLGCKRNVMRDALASELNALSYRLLAIAEHGRTYDFSLETLRKALSEVVAHFPVYRTYIGPGRVCRADREHLDVAVRKAKVESDGDPEVFDFIRDVVLRGPRDAGALAFTYRFQQYTGPVMAKGMEDQALYAYNRLVSLNEVGGEPEHFGVSVPEFHRQNAERLARWPHSMLSTSTHDTKRSEDVRARVNVLSEIPDEWREGIEHWRVLNAPFRRDIEGEPAPSPNDEYLLYQTLLGAWPMGEQQVEATREEFRDRIKAYMEKAMREAQVSTSWTDPNEGYEKAVADFVDGILSLNGPFLRAFLPFQRDVARTGAMNALSQLLLKMTSPGIPDVYQGNEIWDFSLVDPDNRRPVDFEQRKKLLAALRTLDPSDVSTLLEDGVWQDGRPKLYLTRKALETRRKSPELFAGGAYIALETSGRRQENLLAFARKHGEEVAITVVPRLYAKITPAQRSLLPAQETWRDTSILLPHELVGVAYRNVLTGETLSIHEHDGRPALQAAQLLRNFPVALLASSG
jgi:(1->4)-alpha-D-glucan 1-alpha-D-glucosylmutase